MKMTYQNDAGILALEPNGPLEETDFKLVATRIEKVRKSDKDYNGLLIHTKKMDGYDKFTDLLPFGEFAAEYDERVGKIAISTDAELGKLFKSIGENIVKSGVETFDYQERDEAVKWLLAA